MLLLASCLLLSSGHTDWNTHTQVLLWEDPGRRTVSDWIWGPGGEARSPRPPFQFVKENLGGTNAKIEVRDADGALWIVKFGGEVHSAVFGSRLLYAAGYVIEPAYFVRQGVVHGVHGLKRAKRFVSAAGSFHDAVFRLRDERTLAYADEFEWSWTANPFMRSHELSGLKILVMLASNWDAKDARDGQGSNTAVFRRSEGAPAYVYSFTDWGASFGKWGGFFNRTKWDSASYERQTARFARISSDGQIAWGYHGKHGHDLVNGVTKADVAWLFQYLSRITYEQLHAGFIASGATPAVADLFTQSIQTRISQLRGIAGANAGNREAIK